MVSWFSTTSRYGLMLLFPDLASPIYRRIRWGSTSPTDASSVFSMTGVRHSQATTFITQAAARRRLHSPCWWTRYDIAGRAVVNEPVVTALSGAGVRDAADGQQTRSVRSWPLADMAAAKEHVSFQLRADNRLRDRLVTVPRSGRLYARDQQSGRQWIARPI